MTYNFWYDIKFYRKEDFYNRLYGQLDIDLLQPGVFFFFLQKVINHDVVILVKIVSFENQRCN